MNLARTATALTLGLTCLGGCTVQHAASSPPPSSPTALAPSSSSDAPTAPAGMESPTEATESPTDRPEITHLHIGPDGSATVTNIDTEPDVAPAAARTHDAAGAQAFVQFYWDEVDDAGVAGDYSLLAPYATADCVACTGVQMSLAQMAEEGVRMAPSTVTCSAFRTKLLTGDSAQVSYRRAGPNNPTYDANGVRHEGQPYSHDEVMTLKWVDDGWLVDAIRNQE